ncbi:hypothetical protein O988_08057 [Pseudogymnoascus sp. VKM F-3808]|nr:hypothetical protein O988_08057 [Pseudogymnoascus sp. VKM F-3808]
MIEHPRRSVLVPRGAAGRGGSVRSSEDIHVVLGRCLCLSSPRLPAPRSIQSRTHRQKVQSGKCIGGAAATTGERWTQFIVPHIPPLTGPIGVIGILEYLSQ